MAVDNQVGVLGGLDFVDIASQLLERNQKALGQFGEGVFFRGADIDEQHGLALLTPLLKFPNAEIDRHIVQRLRIDAIGYYPKGPIRPIVGDGVKMNLGFGNRF
jgi:hypothetical protein